MCFLVVKITSSSCNTAQVLATSLEYRERASLSGRGVCVCLILRGTNLGFCSTHLDKRGSIQMCTSRIKAEMKAGGEVVKMWVSHQTIGIVFQFDCKVRSRKRWKSWSTDLRSSTKHRGFYIHLPVFKERISSWDSQGLIKALIKAYKWSCTS